MRESLSKALYSDDLEWRYYEMPIDRIAALRGSSRLGSALFRWKHALDHSSRGRAYVLTLKLASRELRIAPRHPAFVTLRLAVKQALTEWHSQHCRTCKGVGIIHVDRQGKQVGVDHVCPRCAGTGIHRYGDWERAAALKVKHLGQWTDRIERIRQMVSAREIGLVVGARRELERS